MKNTGNSNGIFTSFLKYEFWDSKVIFRSSLCEWEITERNSYEKPVMLMNKPAIYKVQRGPYDDNVT